MTASSVWEHIKQFTKGRSPPRSLPMASRHTNIKFTYVKHHVCKIATYCFMIFSLFMIFTILENKQNL